MESFDFEVIRFLLLSAEYNDKGKKATIGGIDTGADVGYGLGKMTAAEFSAPRQAREEDLDEIRNCLNLVHRTLRGLQGDITEAYANVYDLSNIENTIIVTRGGKVVSSAGLLTMKVRAGRTVLEVGGVNAVATVPECRKMGLGSGVMKAVAERMKDLGCHLGLLRTPLSNWYRKMGWEWVGIIREYSLDRGNIGLLPEVPKTTRVITEPPDEIIANRRLDELMRLYKENGFGAVRSESDWKLQLRGRKPEAVLAVNRNAVQAYLLCRGRDIIEWAGEPEVLAGLVVERQKKMDDLEAHTTDRDSDYVVVLKDDVQVTTPDGGCSFSAFLDSLRIPYARSYPGMMNIVDPKGILSAFGLEDISIEARDDGFLVEENGRGEILSALSLAKLLFGPEKVSPLGEKHFPLPFYQWKFDRV